ncbi:MAG: hypothetical protein FWB87_04120 [Defluviitaleaceae bacterium]|nr:hypothetical protein [Defluviitaleaceae bacterium]
MKKFLTLTRWEYHGLFMPLLGIIGVMAALQIILFRFALRGAERHMPLSFLLGEANLAIVFALAFIALLGLVGLRLLMNFTPSKSIYALLTLPNERKRVYQSKLAAAVLAACMLIAAQMLLLLVFNAMAGWLAREAAWGGAYINRRNADFYLALLEAPWLRRIFPTTLFSQVRVITALGGSVCVALYMATALKARRVKEAIIVGVLWLALLLLGTGPFEGRISGPIFFITMVVMALTVSKMGVHLFETGEIAG